MASPYDDLPPYGYDYAEPASSDADTRDLNPAFADRIQDLQQDAELAGIPSTLISGYRSPSLQEKLFAKYMAGTGNIAAAPGRSFHNSGLAADVVADDPGRQAALVAMSRESWRGLQPGADFSDPNHFQIAGAAAPPFLASIAEQPTALKAISAALGQPVAPAAGAGAGAMAPLGFAPAAAPAAAPVASQPSTDAEFAKKWGVDPSALSSEPAKTPAPAAPLAAPPAAPSDDAAFAKKWGVDPSVLAPIPANTPMDRINAAADKLGVRPSATLQEKAKAIFDATHARQMEFQGAGAVQNDPSSSASMATTGNVLSGAPIAGPAILGGVQRTGAGIRSLINGTPYADELSYIQGAQKEADTEHPILATAGSLGGGALAYGLGAAAGGAKALGMAGPLASRVGLGAASGAAIGAADSAVRGNSPTTGALVGGGLGAIAPAIGKIGGELVQAGGNAISRAMPTGVAGVPRSAMNMLAEAMHADNPVSVQGDAARFGDTAMLADLGPSLGGLAQGLAPKPGSAKSMLYDALNARAAGANSRVTNDITSALGPAEDPQAVKNAIMEHRSTTDTINYGMALAHAPDVDPARAVALIDSQLGTAVGEQRKALMNTRTMLVRPGDPTAAPGSPAALPSFVNDAQTLHNVKGELDNVIQYDAPGLGVQAGALNRSNGSLVIVRRALNNALESQVPGYAEANASSAALARRAEAVGEGTNVLGSGKTTQTPEGFAQSYSDMEPGGQVAMNKGIRGEINRIVGTSANDPAALRRNLQGEGGWNTAKLATAFGPDATNALVNAVDREGAFSGTMNRVVSNSQTAQRAGSAKLLADTDPAQVDLKNANWAGLLAHGAKKLAWDPATQALMRTDNTPRDLALARILTAQGSGRDSAINTILANLNNRNATNAVAGRFAAGANVLPNMLLPAWGQQEQNQR